MGWPRDDAKLERVRALMAEEDLDALVVRAPDNVLYLTNFWGMKGYDAVVFPREGEPTLICLEASADDAARTAWTTDVRLFRGYDESRSAATDSRGRSTSPARRASAYGRIGLELSLGTQAADRMVGEPTTYTHEPGSTPWHGDRRRDPAARARTRASRPSRRSSACGSRTRSRRRRWSTSAPTSRPG